MVTHFADSGTAPRVALPPTKLSTVAQLALWLLAGGVVMAASAALLGGLQPATFIVSGIGYVAAASFTLWLFRRGFPHPTLGAGNLVTLGRMALVVSLLAALTGDAQPWVVVAVASVALALDGFDGWLAGSVIVTGAGLPVAITDISERSVCLLAEGPRAAEVLAAGCPLDLDRFAVGRATRTVFEAVEIVVLCTGDARFEVEVWRSFAPWLKTALETAARQLG